MYFFVSQYPELRNHQKPKELLAQFEQHNHHPWWSWILHVAMVALLINSAIPSVELKFLAVLGYSVVFRLVAVNTWQRTQFLAQLESLSKAVMTCPILLKQDELKAFWQQTERFREVELLITDTVIRHIHRYGYLSAIAGESRAPIKVDNLDTNTRVVKLCLALEQILPFALESGKNVELHLGDKPLSAIIKSCKANRLVDIEEQVTLTPSVPLHFVRFETAPDLLKVERKAKLVANQEQLTLQLTIIDNKGLVGFELVSEATRKLVLGDTLEFDCGLIGQVVNVSELGSLLQYYNY